MSWKSGTTLARAWADMILEYVPPEKREEAGRKALIVLEDADWDCMHDVPFFEYVYNKREIEKDNEGVYEDTNNFLEKCKEHYGF